MTNIKNWNEIATKMAETINETVWEYYGHEVRVTGQEYLDVRCPSADETLLPQISASLKKTTDKPMVVSSSHFM